MQKRFKRLFTLALSMSLLISSLVFTQTVNALDLTGGIWVTEVYPNDINRSNEYPSVKSSEDIMDSFEIYNSNSREISINEYLNIYYTPNGGARSKLTFAEQDQVIPANSPAVLWARRTDLDGKGNLLPDVSDVKTALNVPTEVPVFTITNLKGLTNPSGTIEIELKDGTLISSFSYNKNDVGSIEGTSVQVLKVRSEIEGLRLETTATPTLGRVTSIQSAEQVSESETTLDDILWLTEIYPNDISRATDFPSLGATSDVYDYFEIYNSHNEPLQFAKLFTIEFVDDKGAVTVLTYDDPTLIIPANSPAVFWARRVDLENGINILPSETDFRTALAVPSDVPVFNITNLKAIPNATGTIKIKGGDGSVVSEYSYSRNDAGAKEGSSVELIKMKSVSLATVLGTQVVSSAGIVSQPQTILNGDVTLNTNLWLTEIYPNDIPRHEDYPALTSSQDAFDYIEVYNGSDEPIEFAKHFDLVYRDLDVSSPSDKKLITNEANAIIPAKTVAVFWIRRVDLENKGYQLPDETAFRNLLNVPSNAVIFSVNNQASLRNTTAQVSIVTKDGNVISTYKYERTDAGSKEGTSVQLQPAENLTNAIAIEKLAKQTAGKISSSQTAPLADHGVIPTVEYTGKPGEFDTIVRGSDIIIPYTYSNKTIDPESFILEYRTSTNDAWKQETITSFNTRTPGIFYAELGAPRYLGHDWIEYRVTIKNTFHASTTPVHKVYVVDDYKTDDIRTNLVNKQAVNGTIHLITSHNSGIKSLLIDSKNIETQNTLENIPYFSYAISGLDGRKNAIYANGQFLEVISRWYDVKPTRATRVPVDYFQYNQDGSASVTMRVSSGSDYDAHDIISETTRDTFDITQFEIVLADGTKIKPSGPITYDKVVTISPTNRFVDVEFVIPAEHVKALTTTIDTTQYNDGETTAVITANDGTTKTLKLFIDNNGPTIALNVPQVINGIFNVDPQITDATAVDTNLTVIMLDGKLLKVGNFNGSELSEGVHTLSVIAYDSLGNRTIKQWSFMSSNNTPNVTTVSVEQNKVNVTLKPTSETNVSVHQAVEVPVTIYSGYGDNTADASQTTTSTTVGINGKLPFQIYEFNLSGNPYNQLAVSIDVESTSKLPVQVYVLDTNNQWQLVKVTRSGSTIVVDMDVSQYRINDRVKLLVQARSLELAPINISSKTSKSYTPLARVVRQSSWDGTEEPTSYDFSFAWMTDTQYYAEKYPENNYAITRDIVENAARKNTKYVIHTGDLVDDIDEAYEWAVADKAMKILEDGNMPYGVLAGNHDTANHLGRYDIYQQYFGAFRFRDKSFYGESYNDNMAHYDLISVDGQEFIIVYVSFDFEAPVADWVNEVLAKYSDRKAILAFHNYIKKDGTIDDGGKFFEEKVVAKNPNVFLVLNGHYHGASINVNAYDDDKDGIEERTVYRILSDYQSGLEGGLAYYKTLYFDISNNKIYMNAYSPTQNDYNYFDKAKLDSYAPGTQVGDLDIYELDVEFNKSEETLTVSSIKAFTYDIKSIANANNVKDRVTFNVNKYKLSGSYIAKSSNNAGNSFKPFIAETNSNGNAPYKSGTQPSLPATGVQQNNALLLGLGICVLGFVLFVRNNRKQENLNC